ncbi:nuclear exosome regulator NRDE2 [Oryza brachyantha]|uniref:nuclear exosome regulator NRDE2 n=1 Tax=Oryza brachyantha TaxID=4533 RepID=UPI001ADA4933|nr:nuclear exosome regulator NRDE2 [Oryza brachyantha]
MEPPSPETPPPTAAFAAGGEGDPYAPSTTTSSSSSLFPLFPLSAPDASSVPGTGSQWLSNPSFSFDASSLNIPATTSSSVPPPLSASSDEEEAPRPAPAKYDLLPSSPSPPASDEERRDRRKDRKRRKRRREKERYDGSQASRKPGVRAWAGSETKLAKDYYFDAKGDQDNLAFGSIYRMDIARYKSQTMPEARGLKRHLFHNWELVSVHMGQESDLDGLDSKLRAGGRYYSSKYAVVERNKGFKHLKVLKEDISVILPEDFIPLGTTSLPEKTTTGRHELEESWEDEILRRTREFNKMSRECPHNEKVWLDFAQFQDKVASTQPQKAARLQTTERKISILEKAVELNPDNEELLLCLLKSYGERDSTQSLLDKWEQILMKHPDSCKLWKQYLLLCQGEFSRFKVSDLRKSYSYAVQALSAACTKLCRQDTQYDNFKPPYSSLVHLELGLVDIFVNLCRFEWHTGHRELATALFQAQIEYSLFSPPLHLTTSSKQRLFEHFWNNGGARIGEDGALGWSRWLAKEEESRQNIDIEENTQETESGGWSGWFDPSLRNNNETSEVSNKSMEPLASDGNDAEDQDDEDPSAQDDVESLLKKLGIDGDADYNSEVKDPKTWNRWSSMELSRDNEQWMPLHEKSGSLFSDDAPTGEGNDQLSRVILFEDVTDFLFSLSSEEARFSLICQFIDFYGGRISRWTSTNSSSWIDRILSLEMITDDIQEDLSTVSNLVDKNINSVYNKMASLLGTMNDFSQRPGIGKFLKNAILLFLDIFPRNRVLEEAVLVTPQTHTAQKKFLSTPANSSRALAKSLLKKDRQDLLLCGIYGRIEAMNGDIVKARNIFDLALSTSQGASEDLRKKVPILYFWYAEMELAISTSRNNSDSLDRAIHILSCLGNKVKYTSFDGSVSRPQVLKARQGFKEQIRSLRSLFASNAMKEESVALICSASLFESMTSGYASGLEVIEETFSMALSESNHSLEYEELWMHYIKLLQKNLNQLSLSRFWPRVSQGIQTYPYNPKSYAAMLTLGCLYSVSNNLRLTLDKFNQRDPSIIGLLFALSFELCKTGSDNRIHNLFERALADDKLQKSVLLWRCYLAYEAEIACNASAARRVFFRAIHSCPWSKRLWLDGFEKLSSILTLKELSDLQEVMRDKELHIRTDIYEILLQDETDM